jgi:nicotinamidase-related amidase
VLHVLDYVYSFYCIESLFLGVQTPNCIRQTVFDAVALDYQSVTVIVDATAAATPDIHVGMYVSAFLKHVGLYFVICCIL